MTYANSGSCGCGIPPELAAIDEYLELYNSVQVMKYLKQMSAKQRLSVFSLYCTTCGYMDADCKCVVAPPPQPYYESTREWTR